MKNKNGRVLTYIIVLLTILAARVSAEEAGGASGEVVTSDVRSAYMARRQELMELKEKDPEAFRKKVVALRNDAQKRLDGLKESDPETYERVIQRRQQRIGPRFERMREERPEAYERVREHRVGLIEKRVAWFQENDPEKFKEIERRRAMRAQGIQPTQRRAEPGTFRRLNTVTQSDQVNRWQEPARPYGSGPAAVRSERRQSEAPQRFQKNRPAPRRGGPGPGRRNGR